MRSFPALIATVLLTLGGVFVARGEVPLAGGAVDGLLLLKNGETLAGRITRSGDYYVVATDVAELQIRFHDATAVCRNLDEVRRFKAAAMNLNSANDRLDLAQWCIDRGLFGDAARELTEAFRIDDLNPRIPLLERRLKAAMAAPKTPVSLPKPTPVVELSDEVLESTARSISPEAFHAFTTQVQPLLVNYCATAGCHGPRAASDFKLHRIYLNEKNDPRLVRTNLNAVLKQVDRNNLANSRLLTVPLSAHGGGKKPLFHAHNAEHYRQLAVWVARLQTTDTAKSNVPQSVDVVSGALLQRLPMLPPIAAAASTVPQPIVPAAAQEKPAPAAPPVVDPFDPAQFNRRRTAEPAGGTP